MWKEDPKGIQNTEFNLEVQWMEAPGWERYSRTETQLVQTGIRGDRTSGQAILDKYTILVSLDDLDIKTKGYYFLQVKKESKKHQENKKLPKKFLIQKWK